MAARADKMQHLGQVTVTAGGVPDTDRNADIDHPAAQLAVQWARVRGRLQQDVGDVEYRTWLRQMTLAGVDGEEVTVHLPTRFLRDWVRGHYGDKLHAPMAIGEPGDPPGRPSRRSAIGVRRAIGREPGVPTGAGAGGAARPCATRPCATRPCAAGGGAG